VYNEQIRSADPFLEQIAISSILLSTVTMSGARAKTRLSCALCCWSLDVHTPERTVKHIEVENEMCVCALPPNCVSDSQEGHRISMCSIYFLCEMIKGLTSHQTKSTSHCAKGKIWYLMPQRRASILHHYRRAHRNPLFSNSFCLISERFCNSVMHQHILLRVFPSPRPVVAS
jgi:hypothetical protein